MADFGFGFVRVWFGLGVGFGLVWFGALLLRFGLFGLIWVWCGLAWSWYWSWPWFGLFWIVVNIGDGFV